MKRLVWLTPLLILLGCQQPELRPDPYPMPADRSVNQLRLELGGCRSEHMIGTTSCAPGQQAYAVTEHPGKITMASSGGGCSFRRDIAVTNMVTPIPRPKLPSGKSCAVTLIYLPQFPNAPSPIPQRTLIGEVVYQPDQKYVYRGNIAVSDRQTIKLKFPGAVRGAYVSRFEQDPVQFKGDSVSFPAPRVGTDLILVKVWDGAGDIREYSYTANYYSYRAAPLTYSIQRRSTDLFITFPETVSVVMINGHYTFDLGVSVATNFTGYVRAYTAQGRTRVLRFSGGALVWAK